jgi:hypothetical protein
MIFKNGLQYNYFAKNRGKKQNGKKVEGMEPENLWWKSTGECPAMEGFTDADNTWGPEKNLHCPKLMEAFLNSQKTLVKKMMEQRDNLYLRVNLMTANQRVAADHQEALLESPGGRMGTGTAAQNRKGCQ